MVETSPQPEVQIGAVNRLGELASAMAVRAAEMVQPTRRKLAIIGSVLLAHGAVDVLATDLAEAHSTSGKIEANPISYNGQPMSCPDPSVINAPWNQKVLIAECTSDYGQLNPLRSGGYGQVPAALPIYESDNGGTSWQFKNYVFPPGHKANGGEAPLGNWPGPRYWGPELHYNAENRMWETYFATNSPSGQMELDVAWTKHLFGGNWNSRVLHTRGQFNNVAGNQKEGMGGLIDPTVQQDPKTGQLLIAYANQPNQIWLGQLTPNGLYMKNRVKRISYPTQKWEGGVEEGPVLFWNKTDQTMDMFVNTSSTWDGSYKVAFEASADPLKGRWVKYPEPVLKSGNGLYGPGMGSKPIVGPSGQYEVFYHEQTRPNHASQERYLARSPFSYEGLNKMFLPAGLSPRVEDNTVADDIYYFDKKTKQFLPEKLYAVIAATKARRHEEYLKIAVPVIGNGQTQRHVVVTNS